jgi:hypothetical protein
MRKQSRVGAQLRGLVGERSVTKLDKGVGEKPTWLVGGRSVTVLDKGDNDQHYTVSSSGQTFLFTQKFQMRNWNINREKEMESICSKTSQLDKPE